MTIDKRKFLDVLNLDPEFVSEKPTVKKRILDSVTDRESALAVLNLDPEFVSEGEEVKKNILDSFASPEYALGALGSGIDKLVGGIGSGATGMAKMAVESGLIPGFQDNDGYKEGVQNPLTEGVLENWINPAEKYFTDKQKEAHEYEAENLGAIGRFASDAGVMAAEQIGLAAATGGASAYTKIGQAALSGILYGLKATGETYNRMRDTGHTVGESATRSAVTGALQGIGEKITMGMATKMSAPFLKRVTQTAMTAGGVGASTDVAEVSADWIVDKYNEGKDKGKLLDPNMSWLDYVGRFARSAGLGAVGSLGASGAVEVGERLAMHKAGYRKQYIPAKDGSEGFYVEAPKKLPREATAVAGEAVQDMVATSPDPKNISPENIRNKFNSVLQGVAGMLVKRKRALNENVKRVENPLRDKVNKDNIDYQASNIVDRPVSLKAGDTIGVDMRADGLENVGTPVMTEPLKGVITSEEVSTGSERRFNVELENDGGEPIMLTVPEKDLVNYETTVAKWRKQNSQTEGAHLIEFVNELMSNNKNWKDASETQRKTMLGGMFKVVGELKDNALGAVNTKKGLIYNKITGKGLDAESAQAVTAHEIGHWLFNADAQTLQDMGMEGFKSFSDFLNLNEDSPGMSEYQQNTFADFVKESNGNVKQGREKLIESIYGDELNEIRDIWNIYDNDVRKSQDVPASEKMADALSAFLNKPNMDSTDPMFNTKIHKDFLKWVKSNKTLSDTFNTLKERQLGGGLKTNLEESVTRMLKRSDEAKGSLLNKGVWENLLDGADSMSEKLKEMFITEYAPGLGVIKRGEDGYNRMKIMEDKIDKYLLMPANAKMAVKKFMGVLDSLEAKGTSIEDFNNYAFFDRVLNDRKIKTRVEVDADGNVNAQAELDKQGSRFIDKLTEELRGNMEHLATSEQNRLLDKVKKAYEAERARKAQEDIEARQADPESRTITKEVEAQNPLLTTAEQASETLAAMKTRLGKKGFNSLVEARQEMQNIFKEWLLPQLRDSRMYSPEMLKHMEENIHYSKFDVIKHRFDTVAKRVLGDKVAPGYFRQMGTTSDISSPITATMENWVNMAYRADQQQIKRNMLQLMSAADADNIKVEQIGENSKNIKDLNKDYSDRLQKGKRIESVYEYADNGEPLVQHFLVDENLMKPFDAKDPANKFYKIYSDIEGMFKASVTQYMPFFWPVAFAKDVAGAMRAVDGWDSYYKIPYKAIINKYKYIINSWKGKDTPLYNEMTKLGYLTDGSYGQEDVFSEANKLIRKADAKQRYKNDTMANKALAKLTKPFNAMKDFYVKAMHITGEGSEFGTKAAVYEIFKERNKGKPLTLDQRATLRKEAGSPLFAKKGTDSWWMGNLIMFFNPAVQGTYSGIENFKKNKKNAISKMIARSVAKGVVAAVATSGVFGEDIKNAYERIPLRERVRFFTVPLGLDALGQAVYLAMPKDEFSQMIDTFVETAIVSPMMQKYWSAEESFKKTPMEMAAATPSMNPFIKGAQQTYDVFSGGNPRDTFTGRRIFDNNVEARNDITEKFKILAAHWADSIPIVGRVMKFSAKGKPDLRSEDKEMQNNVLETISLLEGTAAGKYFVPFMSYVRTSSYGSNEELERETRGAKAIKARASKAAKDSVKEVTSEQFNETTTPEDYKMELLKAVLKSPKSAKREFRKMSNDKITKLASPDIKPLIKQYWLANKIEKEALLRRIKGILLR